MPDDPIKQAQYVIEAANRPNLPDQILNTAVASNAARALAAAGLLAAPTKSEVPGAMPNQPGDQDHCAVCNHMRWRHHDGVCTEYLDCECNGDFAERQSVASPAAPADDEAALARVRAAIETELLAYDPDGPVQWYVDDHVTDCNTSMLLDVVARAALAALREGRQK